MLIKVTVGGTELLGAPYLFMMLKQFVPSDVCLKCDGCCRFKDADSPWRPRLGAGERASLAMRITQPGWLDAGHHITAPANGGGCSCTFFNHADNTCRIYAHRPFECLLYPFVLSRSPGGVISLHMHLSCPYVQDHLNTTTLSDYARYLKQYFHEPATRTWLQANADLIHDYSAFSLELEHCFDLPALDGPDAPAWRETFDTYCRQTPRALSVYHAAAVFLWQDFFEFDMQVVQGHYVVFARQGNASFAYLPPLGPVLDEAVIRACFERMGKASIARIENISAEDAPLFAALGYRLHLKAHEYIYRREDVAQLVGNAYKSQRHDVNLCVRQADPVLRPYTADDLNSCRKIFASWAAVRKSTHPDPIYQQMIDDNALVHERMLRHAEGLGMIVRVAVNDEQVVGYTAGYPLNDDTFCIYAEVADPVVPGLSAWLFSRFCREQELQPFTFINAMDDFGLPQLGQAKEYWHPVRKIPVYTAAV